MDFNFVPFKDVGGKYSSYYISLCAYGGFGFNSGFYKLENINKYQCVLVSYDGNKKAIGFCFTNDTSLEGACKISHSKNVHSGSVGVSSFFKAHQIDLKEHTGKYIPKKYKDPNMGDIFYILLDEKNK